MPDLSDLIGVRFYTHGRSVSTGFDCYGLAIEVSRRFGHELKDLWYRSSDADTFAGNAGGMIERMAGMTERTDSCEPGNLVVFMQDGRMVHIGVMVGDDMFIHCDRHGVRIMRLSEYYREGILYRWKI